MTAGSTGQAAVTVPLTMLSDVYITRLFDAVVEATEEAIVNAVLKGDHGLEGRDGIVAHALPGERLPGCWRGPLGYNWRYPTVIRQAPCGSCGVTVCAD